MINIAIKDGFHETKPEGLITQYYEDPPLAGAPTWLMRHVLRRWSFRQDVHFIVALVDNRFAGFLFGQSVGERPWRRLFNDGLLMLVAGFYLLLAAKAREALRIILSQMRSRPQKRASDRTLLGQNLDCAEGMPVGLPANCQFARVEFIVVVPASRDQGIAGALLAAFCDSVASHGGRLVTAHISATNRASIAAFKRSRWHVARVSARSMRAWKWL